MLTEKSEAGKGRSLKDIWAAYRKKEVQVEMKMVKDIAEPEPEPKAFSKEEAHDPIPYIRKASSSTVLTVLKGIRAQLSQRWCAQ